jgi:hypothetical protein
MLLKTAIVAAVLTGTKLIIAQSSSSALPLASQNFTYTNLPYKADPNDGPRGTQTGYNICNSTTQNQQSFCQTAIINSVSDFCLWGPPEPNSLIANDEGEMVAWCTQPGHGTRVIPEGTLTAVQFIQTPDYVQVTGLFNQVLIDMNATDTGGELDPHGADGRGNPIGGLMFSNAFPASDGNPNNYIQAVEYHNFVGSGQFCLKACDPSRPNAANYCQHIYDLIGCAYNAPAAYAPDVFESCLGDSQEFPGVYVSNGQTLTWAQPPESLGPITSIPYTPVIPASSDCTTAVSASLYSLAVTPSITFVGSSSVVPSTTIAPIVYTTQTTGSSHTTSTTTGGAMTSAAVNAGWIMAVAGVAAAALF